MNAVFLYAQPTHDLNLRRRLTWQDLQLPPAFCLPENAPLSHAIAAAYEREFDQLPCVRVPTRLNPIPPHSHAQSSQRQTQTYWLPRRKSHQNRLREGLSQGRRSAG